MILSWGNRGFIGNWGNIQFTQIPQFPQNNKSLMNTNIFSFKVMINYQI